MSSLTQSSLGLFVIAVAIVCALTVGMSRISRNTLVPEPLEFVPKRASLVITTGPIKELWSGIDSNFARVLGENDRNGTLASAISEVRELLEDRNTPISTIEDLRGYGIDTDRGLVLAGNLEYYENFIFAVPISDVAAFKGFLQGDEDESDAECLAADLRAAPSVSAEDLQVVFPEVGWALFGVDCALLEDTIRHRKDNLAYARSDDSLLETLRNQFSYPLMSGPRVVVVLRQLQFALSPIVRGVVAVEFAPDKLLLDGILSSGEVNARILSRFLSPVDLQDSWREALAPENPIVFVVRDHELSSYLKLLVRFEQLADLMKDHFGGALYLALQKDSITQLAVSFSQYRDGFPQLLLGIWGEEQELKTLVTDVQTSLRMSRDMRVLKNLLKALPNGELPGGQTPGELLTRESDSLFDQYNVIKGEVDDSGVRISPELFHSPTYTREISGGTIRYLAPQITENDIQFRIDTEVLADADIKMLLENRYRLSSLLINGALWLATDERDLVGISNRLRAVEESDINPTSTSLADVAKLQLVVQVPGLIEEASLSKVDDIEELVRTVLLDLRFHPNITANLSTHEEEREARLHIEAPVARIEEK